MSLAVESSRPLIDGHGHRLEVKLADEPLWVAGDPTRLTQVVVNLLTNSAKYTPEGGHIRLAVRGTTGWRSCGCGTTGWASPRKT